MRIDNIVEPVRVTDWDFTFAGGIPLGVTINEKTGDTVVWSSDKSTVTFHIAAKSISNDSDAKIPERALTICMQHALAYEVSTREITPLTPEQKEHLAQLSKLKTRG